MEPGFLSPMVESKRREVEALRCPEAVRRIEEALKTASPPRGFARALKKRGGYRIIAEMKRKSPSRGVLCAEYDPVRLGQAYEEGGAAALSVLTDSEFFGGDLAHLAQARGRSSLPALRKDFILDEIQIDESRAAGADAVLLIASILPPHGLVRLMHQAGDLGMEPLVEVHDAEELRRAADSGAVLIGVNNRDLRSFRVNLRVSLDLASELPRGAVCVSESGIATRRDLELLSSAGYDAFLVGEALMSGGDPAARLKEWIS